MKRSTPDRLPIRSGSPPSDNHSRSEGSKVPAGEQQRELPFVVTGPGTGAKPRAVTQVNRISVDRRASLETGEGGSVGGDSLGIRGSLASPERQEMGSDGGPTGVRADGTRRNIHSGTREARCGPGESRERAPITGDKPGSGERPHRESEQVIVPSASPRKITRGEGSACTSGHAFEAEGTSGTAGKAQCPRDPDKGLDRVRVLQRKLYRAAKAEHHHRTRNSSRSPGLFIHSTLGLRCLVRDVRSGVRKPNTARRNARRRAVCGKTACTVR